jgi:hypothetical protein
MKKQILGFLLFLFCLTVLTIGFLSAVCIVGAWAEDVKKYHDDHLVRVAKKGSIYTYTSLSGANVHKLTICILKHDITYDKINMHEYPILHPGLDVDQIVLYKKNGQWAHDKMWERWMPPMVNLTDPDRGYWDYTWKR